MTATRSFSLAIGAVAVTGQPEGDARWVIKARKAPRAPLTIGWLLGARGAFHAQTISRPRQQFNARTRRGALSQLVEWAKGHAGGAQL